MKTFVTTAALLLSLPSFAQLIVTDWKLTADTRYDKIPENDVSRLQSRVKVGFIIDANGVVELIGLLSTGSSFNNDWANLATNNKTNEKVALSFRNLSLRKVLGKVTAEAGALSPEPTVGAAGLAPSGWMDGVRVKVNTTVGAIKVVAGSLGEFSNPNAFTRSFQGNFLEVELDRKVFEDLLSETALERYDGDAYVREKLSYDLHLVGDKVIKLFAEALYDVERSGLTYEVGSEFDVLKTLADRYEHRLELKVYYSHIDPSIPNRSQSLTAHFTDGDRVSTQVGGKLDAAGTVNWFARASIGEKKRVDAGLTLKFAKGH